MKNKYPGLWLFFYLFSRCIFLISMLSLAGIFFGQIVSFFRTGSHISFSRDDLYFVIKVGCGVGGGLGSGLWLMAMVEFYCKNKK
ncbi:hypothetical protein CJ745_21325 [Salmonella enterica subsp. enterica]|nr:hypothetical protein [Salmonella enterica]EAW1477776.1 hypothetical protein [Salmonella enterica subsp. enterica]EED9465023.1 hypothetical protein [Salmonella enterica subsp. enterica serovar Abaetetuba]EBP8535615.1 hypothetical protein [Salmonella enterica]EBR1116764.1 hypothetical protein [Salmonella enterica]